MTGRHTISGTHKLIMKLFEVVDWELNGIFDILSRYSRQQDLSICVLAQSQRETDESLHGRLLAHTHEGVCHLIYQSQTRSRSYDWTAEMSLSTKSVVYALYIAVKNIHFPASSYGIAMPNTPNLSLISVQLTLEPRGPTSTICGVFIACRSMTRIQFSQSLQCQCSTRTSFETP